MTNDYINKLVKDLVNYREWKQRVEKIEYEVNDRLKALQDHEGIGATDYSNERVQSTNLSDQTFDIVYKRLNCDIKQVLGKEELEEYRWKKRKVDVIEIALDGLNPDERELVELKYMKGCIVPDKDIYESYEYKYGKNKYYDIKQEATNKLARILGYKEAA